MLLKWIINPDNGCVVHISLGNIHMNVLGWGTETSDRYSFFSQDKLKDTKVKILKKHIKYDDRHIRSRFILELRESLIELILEDTIQKLNIKRHYRLKMLQDGFLSDFVVRAVFNVNNINWAEIARTRYAHLNTNLYYEFPVTNIKLRTQFGFIESEVYKFIAPSNFVLVSYIRDEPPDKWVVHHRLLSSQDDEVLFQIYKFTFNSKVFPFIKWSWIKQHFWLLNERKLSKIPFTFQTSSNSFLKKGDKLDIYSIIRFLPITN